MKVAILGAGFAGLSTAYYLAQKGHSVVVLEKTDRPGGLAAGFSQPGWDWPLEQHYHHLFKSDSAMLNFAKEIGVKINFFRGKTAILTTKGIFPLDSARGLLNLPGLDLLSKLRTGLVLGYFKLSPFWKPLERVTAASFLHQTMGEKSWQLLWEPLFKGKFGEDAQNIPASWFWARIRKRSTYLGYPEGGFTALADRAAAAIEGLGGKILYRHQVAFPKNELGRYHKVVSTFPLRKLPYLGAINLILRLKKPFLAKNTYWLNIGLANFSFLGVMEHTNAVDKAHYGDEHLVYIAGKYLPAKHKYFSLTKEGLLAEYDQDLKFICPDYQASLIDYEVFKAPFAQPVIPLNYSRQVPPLRTTIPGLYQTSLEQVYPWDRGTNYAIELGKKVASFICADE